MKVAECLPMLVLRLRVTSLSQNISNCLVYARSPAVIPSTQGLLSTPGGDDRVQLCYSLR